MRYLLCISLALAAAGCARPYRQLRKLPADNACVEVFRPKISRALYRTSVDVVGKHLGGLMLMKAQDDSMRIVFANEVGITFFDFGFFPDGGFRVYQILPKMDKKAVIKTLRKDFELLLFRHTDPGGGFTLADSAARYHGFPQSKGVNYYITDSACSKLLRMQRASNRKPVMEARMWGPAGAPPDSVQIDHLNFQFSIHLKRIS